jgi:hypothetical protein
VARPAEVVAGAVVEAADAVDAGDGGVGVDGAVVGVVGEGADDGVEGGGADVDEVFAGVEGWIGEWTTSTV